MKDSITLSIQEANQLLSMVAKFPYENKVLIETIAKFVEEKFKDDNGSSESIAPSEDGLGQAPTVEG